jgi:hypothetical protein
VSRSRDRPRNPDDWCPLCVCRIWKGFDVAVCAPWHDQWVEVLSPEEVLRTRLGSNQLLWGASLSTVVIENSAGWFRLRSGLALVQRQGGRRFMLEGVSVDPGCTMLPVSPQISLRVESPLSTGTVECCRRARVSEFCFTPLSPKHLVGQSRWKVVGLDGCGAPAVRGYRLLEVGREGLCADCGPRP